jgi:hypothetical protein
VLGICPRGNHRDDDIATVSMILRREELCCHEDLVARYGPTREAVAAHVLVAWVLVFCFACGVSTPFIL